MAGLLDGKVALISGAARGQGRSHALRLASEGAAIVGFDVCRQVPTVQYPMSTPEDLAETVRLVEGQGGRMLAEEVDVRDRQAVERLVESGLSVFGRIDIVAANAGVCPVDADTPLWKVSQERWADVIDINAKGVWQTISAAVPPMIERGEGGSIVITSSTAGVKGIACMGDYAASKHAVVGLMRTFAVELAPHSIRVNTVHPTGVNTPMVTNEVVEEFMTKWPGAENLQNLLPVEMIEADDVSDAVLYLASDAARYVTGTILPVDAGILAR
jgi:SDR family mycofactocin-dependent oxidoreductase